MSIQDKLEALGIELPGPPEAAGNYERIRRVGNLAYLSGVISAHRGVVLSGTLGGDRVVEEGYSAARACGMLHLAVLRDALGSLDHVAQVVSVTGFVQCARGFKDFPAVLNGYSDMMADVFGAAGKPTRAAVGVSGLPRGAMVEVQAIVEVRD